jgi:hypothetical protein
MKTTPLRNTASVSSHCDRVGTGAIPQCGNRYQNSSSYFVGYFSNAIYDTRHRSRRNPCHLCHIVNRARSAVRFGNGVWHRLATTRRDGAHLSASFWLVAKRHGYFLFSVLKPKVVCFLYRPPPSTRDRVFNVDSISALASFAFETDMR